MPFAPMAAPFAPPRQVTATPEPSAPAPPFAPTTGSSSPAPAVVAGPLGAVAADPAPADDLHRPITAVTGAAPAPLAHVPTGPRLHLRIDSATSMIATLDGESEAITLDELRDAAAALARADGSAVIVTGRGGVRGAIPGQASPRDPRRRPRPGDVRGLNRRTPAKSEQARAIIAP